MRLRLLSLAISAAVIVGTTSAARADGIGEAIGEYIIQKYHPQKVLVIGTKEAVLNAFGGGLADYLKEKKHPFASELLDVGVRSEGVGSTVDYLMKNGPFDLVYCASIPHECGLVDDFLEQRGYSGTVLDINLYER